MATNNKPASAYADRYKEGLKSARKNESDLANLDMSVGNIDKSKGEYAVKKDGIKIRGTGAAQRGVMARGPMA